MTERSEGTIRQSTPGHRVTERQRGDTVPERSEGTIKQSTAGHRVNQRQPADLVTERSEGPIKQRTNSRNGVAERQQGDDVAESPGAARAGGRRRPPAPAVPAVPAVPAKPASSRVRMSATQRREQLITIGRQLFAERGFDATSIEEVAARAKVSKPVVYEHFGGKEGLYAVVVDREVRALLDRITTALTGGHPRELLEQAALALLDYIEEETSGFRVLVRESPVLSATGNFSSVMNDVAHQVEHILGAEFKSRGYDPKLAELYSQALVGMVALTGRWWLEVRKPRKETVAVHLVNLAWNGLSHLEAKPRLLTRRRAR